MKRTPSKAADPRTLAGTTAPGTPEPGARGRTPGGEQYSASAIERQLVRESMRSDSQGWIEETLAERDGGPAGVRRKGYAVVFVALLVVLGVAVYMLRDASYGSLPALQWIEAPLLNARDKLQQWVVPEPRAQDTTGSPGLVIDPNTELQPLQQAQSRMEQAAQLVPALNDDPRFKQLLEELRQAGERRD